MVVPTPIGNLEDITLRALRELREAPVILAEDTRRTRQLLAHYDISNRLVSYHRHNERARIELALEMLAEHDVALVTDAGMPAISDPGFELIAAAVAAGVEVDTLPGPSAVTTSVAAAGMKAPGFLFGGFLPRRRGERRSYLHGLRDLPFLLVFYEAPSRLVAALEDVLAELGERQVAVCRELSKLHQEIARGPASRVLDRYRTQGARGECTLVIAPGAEPLDRTADALLELRRRRAAGEDRRAAISAVGAEYGVGRNILYRAWLASDETTADDG